MAKRIRVLPLWMMEEEPDDPLSSKSPRKRKIGGGNKVAKDINNKNILKNFVSKVETAGTKELDQTKNAHQMSDEDDDLEIKKLKVKKETVKVEVNRAGESSSSNIVVKREIKREIDETNLDQLGDGDSDNLHQMSNAGPELNNVKIKNEIIEEEFINAVEVNGEQGSSSLNNIVEKEIKKEINETSTHQVSDEEESSPGSQEQAKKCAAGGESSEENSRGSDATSTPQRECCMYKSNCYRKNPQHRKDFSHPGDDDYKDRPECPFGTSCYRKSVLHRSQYNHTKPPSRNATQKPKKQKDPLEEDDEDDDYDYDDPFLNDNSSDDYQPTDTSDDDDDDGSIKDDTEEEVNDSKRMLKEAKKFVQKK